MHMDEAWMSADEFKNKIGGGILGYDNCPYLIILNLNLQIAIDFWIFKVEED